MDTTHLPQPGGTEVLEVRPADGEHQVVTFTARTRRDPQAYCKTPCPGCPWRTDQVGSFPAEAFRHSARTAYDMSEHVFSCHAAGLDRPLTCAGFLLSTSADHNLSVRLSRIKRRGLEAIKAPAVPLFDNYRDMAVANGVDPDDPALHDCR